MGPEIHDCPVETTLKVIGGRWKTVILFHLQNQTLRFGELKKKMPGITQKMLTQQLKELEKHGVVNRKVYAQVPPKVEYSMTEFGKSLAPILKQMGQWGTEHKRRMAAKVLQPTG